MVLITEKGSLLVFTVILKGLFPEHFLRCTKPMFSIQKSRRKATQIKMQSQFLRYPNVMLHATCCMRI